MGRSGCSSAHLLRHAHQHVRRFLHDSRSRRSSTKTWDGGFTNKWADGANWSSDGVPTADNDVVLDHSNVAGAYTVQVTSLHTQVVRTLTVDGGNTNNIRLVLSSDGAAAGSPWLANGNGLNDISISGTYRRPLVKDDNNAPRFRVEIPKGLSNVTQKALTSNVATLTTFNNVAAGNGLVVGDTRIVAQPADPVFDGTYVLTAVAATTFSYAKVNAKRHRYLDVWHGPARHGNDPLEQHWQYHRVRQRRGGRLRAVGRHGSSDCRSHPDCRLRRFQHRLSPQDLVTIHRRHVALQPHHNRQSDHRSR